MVQTTIAETNRSLLIKTVEKFYVSFYQMPENISNILGREVSSISRPTINFTEYEVRNKGVKQAGETVIDYQPIDIIFFDDTNSLVTHALYEQVLRQTHQSKQEHTTTRFNISVKLYSAEAKIVEECILKNCFIQSITHSEQIYADSTNNLITTSVVFNDLEYNFPVLEE